MFSAALHAANDVSFGPRSYRQRGKRKNTFYVRARAAVAWESPRSQVRVRSCLRGVVGSKTAVPQIATVQFRRPSGQPWAGSLSAIGRRSYPQKRKMTDALDLTSPQFPGNVPLENRADALDDQVRRHG